MNKKAFYTYLDHPGQVPEDEETKALADLFQEVSELESPDPGPAYWQQFNHRLQQRIDGRKKRKKNFFSAWLLGGAAMACALIAALILIPGPGTDGGPEQLTASLEALDADALALLNQAFDSGLTEDEYSLNDPDINLLVDTFSASGETAWVAEDFADFDAEAFISLWENEG